MMRSFWLSALALPAARLDASTHEAIKMFFIDAPLETLGHLTESPANGWVPRCADGDFAAGRAA